MKTRKGLYEGSGPSSRKLFSLQCLDTQARLQRNGFIVGPRMEGSLSSVELILTMILEAEIEEVDVASFECARLAMLECCK